MVSQTAKVVSFEVTFEGVKWLWASDSWYMIPDLWSSRGESTTSKIGFCPGNMQTISLHFD